MARASEGTKTTNEGERAEESVQAFRDALEKSITISRERLQEVVDDAVRRGRMTRGDAEEIVNRVVMKGRDQAEEMLRQLDKVLTDAVTKVDKPLARADRVRRKARVPGLPITAYDQLTVPQIEHRLVELNPSQLRKVQKYELKHKARKGLLRSLDRTLSS